MSEKGLNAPVRGWLWLVIIGPVVTIVGIIIGSLSVGSMCGSVFSPKNHVAELYDSLRGSLGGAASSCEKSIAAAAVPTWILIVLGIALILVGIIIRAIGKNRATGTVAAPTEPTIASRLEDLARLKDQGLISIPEYDLKRTELMRQL